MKLPSSIKTFAQEFRNKGYELYLVGGAVRNLILGISPKDYDFATNAKPEDVVMLFKRVIPTGIKHGTVTVLFEDSSFEVTTYRIDGDYSDSRKPDQVTFTTDLVEDLSRRDFTINSMAYSVLDDTLIDPFDGQGDLKKGIIKTVGEPQKRFSEDALRILRAIRFASQLGYEIETNSWIEVKNLCQSLARVSRERIRDEFLKTLLSKYADYGLRLLFESNIIEHVLGCKLDSLSFDLSYFKRLTSFGAQEIVPRLAYFSLFFGSTIVSEAVLRSLKLTNNEVSQTKKLVELIEGHGIETKGDYELRRILSQTSFSLFPAFIEVLREFSSVKSNEPDEQMLAYCERGLEIAHSKPPVTIAELAIDGGFIMGELGIPKGRLVGDILQFLLDEVLREPRANTAATLTQIAKQYIAEKANL